MANRLTIMRRFDAPRELVWKEWTEPRRLRHWWGPKGYTSPMSHVDLHAGGEYITCMRSPEGKDYWSKGVYLEVAAPERLVMTDSFADDRGNTVPASYYGFQGDWPAKLIVTVTLEDEGGRTLLTLTHSGLERLDSEHVEGMMQGWNEAFDKLAEALVTDARAEFKKGPGPHDVAVTALFDGTPDNVFKVFTSPRLVPQWWGPRNLDTEVDTMDVRPGGKWRYVQRDTSGKDYAFHGEYREVVPPERLVYTLTYEGVPDHEVLVTVKFEDLNGKTRLVYTSTFPSVEYLDGMLASGMEEGAFEAMERFADVLSRTYAFPRIVAPACTLDQPEACKEVEAAR